MHAHAIYPGEPHPGKVVRLFPAQGTGEDSQLLLWLSKSTALLQQWQWTLQSLGVAVQKQVGGKLCHSCATF